MADEHGIKPPKMGDIRLIAKEIVFTYVVGHLDKTDPAYDSFNINDVYVVWFCKTLQNWKALLSTNLPDGMYYELTYDGDKRQTYLDAYKKFENLTIKDGVKLGELR